MKIREVRKFLDVKSTPVEEKTEEDLAMDIGTMITELRIIKGITQRELADEVRTKQPSIARLENGSYLPSLGFLFRIAKSLNTYLLAPKFGLVEESKNIASTTLSTAKINTPMRYPFIKAAAIDMSIIGASSSQNDFVIAASDNQPSFTVNS